MAEVRASEVVAADVVLVGGGLASSFIALCLKESRPNLRVIILERDRRIGGEHTWCHFATDLPQSLPGWLTPLIVKEWPGYEVRFPNLRRRLSTPYRAITSDRLHEVVAERLGADVWLGIDASDVKAEAVRLVDGRRLTAPLVIDARGPRRSPSLALAWQKFLGQEVRLSSPHGLSEPIVMDATVPQLDGYRFLYVLPMAADRLLIEDTRYSDAPALDRSQLARDIAAYAASQGWTVAEQLREEVGVLPIALAGDIEAFWQEADGHTADAGTRAALFHPTTGYSLPDAARQATAIAALPNLTSAAARTAISEMSKRAWRERGFYRLLNRMLFRAASPPERYRVLQRFYRLPQPLIERFYAGHASLADKLRILVGRPPVPVSGALACIAEKPFLTDRALGG
jgi:lycopene beta-cyclase